MKERVTTRLGMNNVLLVAPHAHDLDDTHTDLIALAAADYLNAHAVVNNAWKRAKKVDELKSEANCNDINHCLEPVVKAEFLDPIMSAIDLVTLDDTDPFQMRNNGIECYVFMVHGVGNAVRTKANDPKLDLIVGFGAGNKPYYTCEEWQRDCFIDLCRGNFKWKTYAGAPGGDYSARSKNNMTQAIFRETGQPTMQLEFVYARRNDEATARTTGEQLGKIIEALLKHTSYQRPSSVNPPPEI